MEGANDVIWIWTLMKTHFRKHVWNGQPEMCWGSHGFMVAWVEHTGCANFGPFPIINRSWKSTFSFFFKYLYSGSDHPFNPSLFQWKKCRFCDWICKIMYSDHTIVLTYIFHPPWKKTKILKISHSVFEQEHCLLIVTNKLHYVYAWFIINQIIFAWKFKDFFKQFW